LKNLSALRAETMSLARELYNSLAQDRRVSRVRLFRPTDKGLRDGRTGGYYITLGQMDRSRSLQLWLDTYSGLGSPRAWFGFQSASSKPISGLVALAARAGFCRGPIVRSGRDVTNTKPYQFIRPLQPNQFDTLIRENYSSLPRYYLGVFASYLWPFSAAHRRAIVRDATNLYSNFCAALEASQKDTGGAPGSVGPWAQPDPRTEGAAVRCVRRLLRKEGYDVRSREREICGYDLHATSERGELHVEVKGCAGDNPRFFLSRNEFSASKSDPRWRLVVVTAALGRPQASRILTRSEMTDSFALAPAQWVAEPKVSSNHLRKSSRL
jgi:uncharacterized protein DUF3883